MDHVHLAAATNLVAPLFERPRQEPYSHFISFYTQRLFLMINLHPVTNLDLVDTDQLMRQAESIIEKVLTWQKGKTHTHTGYNGQSISVPTYHTHLDGTFWAARYNDFSECPDSTKAALYDSFVKYLAGSLKDMTKSHTEYEGKYVDELFDYKITPCDTKGDKTNAVTYLIQSYYKLQFPLAQRVFYELVHVKMDPETRSGIIVQVPIAPTLVDTSEDTGFVVGTYGLVEKFWFTPGSDELIWTVAICSSPGGAVPDWITKLGLAAALTKDVPKFMNWLKITI